MNKIIILTIIILSILTILWIILVFNPPQTERFTECAIDLCDKTIQDWHYRNGGQKYYARYEQGSKEYWSAYCSQMASLPEELDYYKCK